MASKQQQKSKKGNARAMRNRIKNKCNNYRLRKKREENKMVRLIRHLAKPQYRRDIAAIVSLSILEAQNPLLPMRIRKKYKLDTPDFSSTDWPVSVRELYKQVREYVRGNVPDFYEYGQLTLGVHNNFIRRKFMT